MKTALIWIVLILMTQLSVVTAQQAKATDVTLTVDNRGATAYFLSEATAPGIAELGTDNATWTLRVGQRYRILNVGGAVYHPLELRAGDDVVLSQLESSVGSLEANIAIAFQSDDESISFILTPMLAQQLSRYSCAYHTAMTGNILIIQSLAPLSSS